jgi:hypothetical protein
MRRLILFIRIFAYVWVALAFSLVITSLRPFSLKNYLITLVAFAPALAAFLVARSLEQKTRGKESGAE